MPRIRSRSDWASISSLDCTGGQRFGFCLKLSIPNAEKNANTGSAKTHNHTLQCMYTLKNPTDAENGGTVAKPCC